MRAVISTLIPVVAALAGATFVAFRKPSERLQSDVQHFAAGIIFGAAALELLPPIRQQAPIVAITGFLVGVVTMAGSRHLSRKIDDARNDGARASGLIVAAAIDVLIDGVILGATFTLGARQGSMLTVALALGLLFLGLSVATTLRQAEVPSARIIPFSRTSGLHAKKQ